MTNSTNDQDDESLSSQSPFEQIKQSDPDGNEFWSARDLMPILEYGSWRNFKNVLLKARTACENSGDDPADHLFPAIKIITNDSDVKREIEDMHLSRYACYLVIQNADASKTAVAQAQTYFAMQTRRQELSDQSYQGLYNGLTAEDIHRKKKLKKSQHILDHMGTTELAANLFRSTQAEEKLRRDNIQGKENANQVHYQAGVVVRRAIAELGGTMPEDLPNVESIKKLERGEKKRLGSPKPNDK
ncbi:MAG: DNA damage-inducible protein D [Anaerolineae bacterium]|nr:DNA damage-inducible protein D [Anaerolineae bacterium]